MSRPELLVQASARLRSAGDIAQLTEIFHGAVDEGTRYCNAWIAVHDIERDMVRLMSCAGSNADDLLRFTAMEYPISTDPFLQEILRAGGPVVVADAQADPRTNKEVVAVTGSRTIINIPFGYLDEPYLIVGTGTFAPEAVMLPTAEEVETLTMLGALVSVAMVRIRYLEAQQRAEAERKRLEAQLLQAQKLRSLGLLAGGVAHDFNNLLAAMLGHAEVGLMSTEPAARTRSLRTIQIAALQAQDLTSQMLAYAGRGPFLLKDFDLTGAARELVRLVGAGHSRQVTWSVSGGRAGVRGDTSQIRQVLLNLFTNAADAIGDAPGTIDVTIARVDALPAGPWILQGEQGGPLVLLTVADTGVGMTEAIMEQVFDPFFSTKEGGRGLGMASVLGIIDKHSGSLRVESVPGEGSTFSIALPWIALDEDHSAAPAVAKRRILVADNEPAICAFLGAVLERQGHEVVLASGGTEALTALRTRAFDVCILDVLMPELAGPEVVRAARAEGIRVPTLLISGFTQRYSVLSEPDVAFVQKPLSSAELLQALQSLLS